MRNLANRDQVRYFSEDEVSPSILCASGLMADKGVFLEQACEKDRNPSNIGCLACPFSQFQALVNLLLFVYTERKKLFEVDLL